MTKFVPENDWRQGIDNRSDWRTPPPNTVRDSVNLDTHPAGGFSLRTGYEAVYTGTDIRGAVSVAHDVLVADGTSLVAVHTDTQTSTVLTAIAGGGLFAGDVLNDEALLCTANESLRYKSGLLRAWGVPTVTAQPVPTVTTGGLKAGTYQLAVTLVNQYGEEGGTSGAIQIAVPDNAGLVVTLPSVAGHTAHLYASAVDGSTLYLQETGTGAVLLAAVRDDTARLATMHHTAPPQGSQVVAHNGVVAVVAGGVVWLTTPLRPHLVERSKRFFQYSTDVGFVISSGEGLYISADKTYFVRGVEGETPEQATVAEYPGVPGTQTKLPDGRAAWMTQYGLAIGDGKGDVSLVSQANFVPELASYGASGIVEGNGNQQVVTTLRGGKGANPLAASDYYEAEIFTP